MPAIMRTIAPAEHLSSGNKHEMNKMADRSESIKTNQNKQPRRNISFNFFFQGSLLGSPYR